MPKRKKSDVHFIDLTQEIDVKKLRLSIQSDFSDFPDPRRGGNILYPAWYLMFVILCGYLAGGNTIEDLADFADLREEWLAEITGIEVGAPSYDTLWWFLVRTLPNAFKQLISRWLKGLPADLRDQLLNIDGKRLRGISDGEHICHLVELFAAESQLVIAQERVPDKHGEAIALPMLLDTIDVTGAIVSLDALYAHISDIKEITKRGADYIVGIKGNQGNLEAEVKNFFTQVRSVGLEECPVSSFKTEDKAHGRLERRTIIVTNDLDWLPQREAWELKSLIEVHSIRYINDQTEEAVRYYGSSRQADARAFAKWVRGHWSIENSLHYVMDVTFGEDASLSDTGHSAENIALIKRLAMNIVKAMDPKRGMAAARRAATFEPRYLRGLLGRIFC
jgi:predicted transposase YbfD/YdcC